jgi:hypothetical protein
VPPEQTDADDPGVECGNRVDGEGAPHKDALASGFGPHGPISTGPEGERPEADWVTNPGVDCVGESLSCFELLSFYFGILCAWF